MATSSWFYVINRISNFFIYLKQFWDLLFYIIQFTNLSVQFSGGLSTQSCAAVTMYLPISLSSLWAAIMSFIFVTSAHTTHSVRPEGRSAVNVEKKKKNESMLIWISDLIRISSLQNLASWSYSQKMDLIKAGIFQKLYFYIYT